MNQLKQASLYEQDFALWIDETVAKLQAHQFEDIDLENLIEEIESLGKSHKRELRNRLTVLLAHILKRIYIDSAYDNRGWMETIDEQRRQIKLLLADSPSLQVYFQNIFTEVYGAALKTAHSQYQGVTFPSDWPFSHEIDAVLEETFWTRWAKKRAQFSN